MAKALIIVESPTKIKTLKKFLGDDYLFESSLGHIRDLPEKGIGIDFEHDFEPEYEVLPGKKEVVDKLKKAAAKADIVYLCPDPDREGEAIAWHIASLLPPGTKMERATFQSITADEVRRSLEQTRPIDMALVNAQQARRVLDRLVGYKISPLLARRIARGRDGGLSAGRVQSVALKLVVDREKQILGFKPVEYWTLEALLLTQDRHQLKAHLFSVDGKKVEKEPIAGKDVALISNEATAKKLQDRLKRASFHVAHIDRKEKQRHPVPPFITSTLQQEASRHYGFSAQRTMSIAQSLYEGVDLGHAGPEGLITYMRTDSVRMAPEAVEQVRKLVAAKYGKEYLPASPRHYASKKSAQDAHEAIRPSNMKNTPESVKQYLTTDQYRLYLLIWRRAMASQMASAVYDTVTVDVGTNDNLMLRSTGSQLKFNGFLAVYEEGKDEGDQEDDTERLLPFLNEQDPLRLESIDAQQSFTKPPPRFTEASLVKELEKSGIGRPSTYAAIMNKIQSRDYTSKEKGSLRPTELGCLIAQMLEENFALIMQVGFTAAMEDQLEEVAENRKDWHEVVADFWEDFDPLVEQATQEMRVPKIDTDMPCPQCQGHLQKIWAKGRYFLGCSNYPECSYTTTLEETSFNKDDYAADFDWDQVCPKCGKPMKVRHGKYGAFLGCTGYPECNGVVNIPKKGEAGKPQSAPCPAIGCTGTVLQRRSWRGKVFYSCSEYPACDVIVNDLNQLGEKYASHPKTAYVAKEKAARGKGAKAKAGAKAKPSARKKASTGEEPVKKAGPKEKGAAKKTTSRTKTQPVSSGLTKSYRPSPALAKVVGDQLGTRPEMTKRLWDYIKANDLQDSTDRRVINPDANLKKALGIEGPVNMMQLPRHLTAGLESAEG
jgi:DNA topoisomerase-1